MANKNKKRKRKLKRMQREQLLADRQKRRTIRHNTATNQEKHRADWQSLEPDEFGRIAHRRIMPRDELDRRQEMEILSTRPIRDDFDDDLWTTIAAESPHQLGIVMEVAQGLCRVSLNGGIILCHLRGSLTAEESGFTNVVAVGDRVLVNQAAEDQGMIEAILPRRSGLSRPDSFYTHLQRIIAANVDQLLIVSSWREPTIWLEMIDEYLIGAARNNLDAIICINKIDLADDIVACERQVQAYFELGHCVIFTSAITGAGLRELSDLVHNRTTVMAGLSGVGKSTLLSAIDPDLDLRIGEVNRKRGQGRHTTTQATMLPLERGGYVVDTPGIRDFGIMGLTRPELISFYPEIGPIASQCRYCDCSHSHEPGCAVKAAVAQGAITSWRLENYRSIFSKLPE
jgi:ribosome biogenesis GTPase